MKSRYLDAAGYTIRVGDVVRVMGVPDITGLTRRGQRESRPVFDHIIGQYKRVADLNASGLVELSFRI